MSIIALISEKVDRDEEGIEDGSVAVFVTFCFFENNLKDVVKC